MQVLTIAWSIRSRTYGGEDCRRIQARDLTTDKYHHCTNRTPWASAKPFYFIARYYSLVALMFVPSIHFEWGGTKLLICSVKNSYQFTCREWIVFESISVLILELSVQVLLMLRCECLSTTPCP